MDDDEPLTKKQFRALGIDLDDHESVFDFRQNMKWVAQQRQTAKKIGLTVLIGMATATAFGLFKLAWYGVLHYLQGGGKQ